MSFQLHLIRHGQSANNALPESDRVEDPDLTPMGVREAETLANRYASVPLTHLLTSGFRRALQTTQPLARRFATLRPAIWSDLHEVGGCYAGYVQGNEVGRPGMNREALGLEFPEFDCPDDIGPNGWWQSRPYETWETARRRARRVVERFVNEFENTSANVACVIHADFKALLLEALLPQSHSEFVPADLKNTGVTVLRRTSARFDVLKFNCVEHLS